MLIGKFFLLPLLLSVGWWLFLRYFGLSIEQGKKGFYWIIGISAGLLGFFSLMIFVTS